MITSSFLTFCTLLDFLILLQFFYILGILSQSLLNEFLFFHVSLNIDFFLIPLLIQYLHSPSGISSITHDVNYHPSAQDSQICISISPFPMLQICIANCLRHTSTWMFHICPKWNSPSSLRTLKHHGSISMKGSNVYPSSQTRNIEAMRNNSFLLLNPQTFNGEPIFTSLSPK